MLYSTTHQWRMSQVEINVKAKQQILAQNQRKHSRERKRKERVSRSRVVLKARTKRNSAAFGIECDEWYVQRVLLTLGFTCWLFAMSTKTTSRRCSFSGGRRCALSWVPLSGACIVSIVMWKFSFMYPGFWNKHSLKPCYLDDLRLLHLTIRRNLP